MQTARGQRGDSRSRPSSAPTSTSTSTGTAAELRLREREQQSRDRAAQLRVELRSGRYTPSARAGRNPGMAIGRG
ncbi:hypothetical protein MXD62_15140 [Frankia sp. Mgl5]|nr:hypothetical protein [Frankia sp. Mgl5]